MPHPDNPSTILSSNNPFRSFSESVSLPSPPSSFKDPSPSTDAVDLPSPPQPSIDPIQCPSLVSTTVLNIPDQIPVPITPSYPSRNPFLAESEQIPDAMLAPVSAVSRPSPPNTHTLPTLHRPEPPESNISSSTFVKSFDSSPSTSFPNEARQLFESLTLRESPTRDKKPPKSAQQKSSGVDGGRQSPTCTRPSRSLLEPSNGTSSSPSNAPTTESRTRLPRNNKQQPTLKNTRRNSDGSPNSNPSAVAEGQRRSRRHRENRDGKERDKTSRANEHSGKSTKTKKPTGFDLIDKLDVTGLYGSGLFHHDGPFDACHPHRNRKGSSRAPMNAFPENSANNSLGGAGPLNKTIDMDQFHGTGAEGWTDYGNLGSMRSFQKHMRAHRGLDPAKGMALHISATERIEQIHGVETVGLGTSTFLEGTPAPQTAIKRREPDLVEHQQNQKVTCDQPFSPTAGVSPTTGMSSLQRKKSLAQRIRGMSQGRVNRPIYE